MEKKENLSRRDLLKALTAAGGAVAAAAFLPNKWTKPVVDAGVLPAHAQSTEQPPIIDNLSLENDDDDFYGSFTYYDPLGEVDGARGDAQSLNVNLIGGTLFTISVEPCGQLPFNDDPVGSNGSANGYSYFGKGSGPYNGSIGFGFQLANSCWCTNQTQSLMASMKVNGRLSNTLNTSLYYCPN